MAYQHSFFAVVLFAGAALSARPAIASDLDVELAAQLGGGSPSLLFGPNPLAVGVGARGGVVWRDRFYLGAGLMAYLGESAPEQAPGGPCFMPLCPTRRVSAHATLAGFDAGYDFNLAGVVTVRPQVGAGYMVVNTTAQAVGTVPASRTDSGYLYVEPGLTVLVAIGHGLFVGVDGTALWLASDETASVVFTGDAQAGVRF